MTLELGEWQEAREAIQHAAASDPRWVGNSLQLWLLGNYDQALTALHQEIEEARQHDDVQALVINLTELADRRLQLLRVQEAEAPAREVARLARDHSGPVFETRSLAPLTETLARLGAVDYEALLDEADASMTRQGHLMCRPQLRRARGIALARQGKLHEALEALQESAEVARAREARIDLGRTLAVLAEVAHTAGREAMAQEADAERAAIVARIGPEVRGLAWAQGCP
jgi:hypothetical protein